MQEVALVGSFSGQTRPGNLGFHLNRAKEVSSGIEFSRPTRGAGMDKLPGGSPISFAHHEVIYFTDTNSGIAFY